MPARQTKKDCRMVRGLGGYPEAKHSACRLQDHAVSLEARQMANPSAKSRLMISMPLRCSVAGLQQPCLCSAKEFQPKHVEPAEGALIGSSVTCPS